MVGLLSSGNNLKQKKNRNGITMFIYLHTYIMY